jgi:hypothetical protein
MALGKNLTLDNGVTVTYFRIDSLTFKPGSVVASVGVYTNDAAAHSNKKPVVTQSVELNSVQFTKALVDRGDLMSTVYTAIKAFAAGPSTLGDIQINKKYLDGTFTDV